MGQRTTTKFIAATLMAFLVCASHRSVHGQSPVIVVSIDGLRRDVVTEELMPVLNGMAQQGAWAFNARSLFPTFTIPNHVSLVTGTIPFTHGIDLIADPGDLQLEDTVLHKVAAAGHSVGVYLSKNKLRLLTQEADQLMITDTGESSEIVDALIGDIAERNAAWDLTLIHLTEPDAVGHRHQWLSPEYYLSLKAVDQHLARIVEAVRATEGGDRVTWFISTDHGGEGFSHGAVIPSITRIPWIANGPGIEAGTVFDRRVGVHDTAASLLWLFGLEIPEHYEGVPVSEIYGGDSIQFQRGDANADGRVDLTDGIQIFSFLFLGGDAPACRDAADAADTGTLDLSAGIYLLNFLFTGGPPPAPPFENCGLDAKADQLGCGEFPGCL